MSIAKNHINSRLKHCNNYIGNISKLGYRTSDHMDAAIDHPLEGVYVSLFAWRQERWEEEKEEEAEEKKEEE